MELEEYTQYHETTLHEQPGFSYNTYLCTIPQDFDRVGLHWHEQMEIIYIKKGSGTVSVSLSRFHVEAGWIIPILPGELHSIEGDPGIRMEYENIIFSLSVVDSSDEDDWCRSHVIDPLKNGTMHFPRPLVPGTKFHGEVSLALDTADHICENRMPGYSLLVKSQLFVVLHSLYRNRGEDPASENRTSSHAEKLKKVISWVRNHYSEPVNVEQAASLIGYSEAHFMRIFKEETGQTFTRFLIEYRLSAASYYLKETEESVSVIAENCGFDNLSYFIRSFKKKYGASPGVYRKNQIHNSNIYIS